jgi:DNA-directed RNA polymerase specialized sigma24 family protein
VELTGVSCSDNLAEVGLVAIGMIDGRAEDPADCAQREDAWEETLRGLSMAQRSAIVLHFRHRMTFTEIGVVIGLDKRRVSEAFAAAIEQLRESGRYMALAN